MDAVLNPYKPSVPFRETADPDQTPQNAAAGLHCFLTGISI